jgi:hypothetical protein
MSTISAKRVRIVDVDVSATSAHDIRLAERSEHVVAELLPVASSRYEH